jgi:hypothetical protein
LLCACFEVSAFQLFPHGANTPQNHIHLWGLNSLNLHICNAIISLVHICFHRFAVSVKYVKLALITVLHVCYGWYMRVC